MRTSAVRASLLAALLVAALGAGPARAESLVLPGPFVLRSPQVAVGGTGLQAFLDSRDANVDVGAAQAVGELLRSGVDPPLTYSLLIELSQTAGGVEVGVYNGHDVNPTPMPIFGPTAGPGWFAVVSYRNSPTRILVSVFDSTASARGSTTYPGGDRDAVGFYVSGPGGTFYSQDHRNLSGAPQCLTFVGTGIHTDELWFTFEDQPLVHADHDFDDCVLWVRNNSSRGLLVETQHTSWGRLKQRFR